MDEEDTEKNNLFDSFQIKVIFVAVAVVVVVLGIYFFISPYQNCMRELKEMHSDRGIRHTYCTSDDGFGHKWQEIYSLSREKT